MSTKETENFASLFNFIKNIVGKVDIDGDFGFVNPDSDSSFIVRKDGNISLSAGNYSQIKQDKDGCINLNSLMTHLTSVVTDVNTSDININRHKFNNQLIELTDFRDVGGNVIGGMMMDGTVLVKTYEHTLGKWVLMRRPISTPMFSQRLNIPLPPEQMEIKNLDMQEDIRKHYIEKQKDHTDADIPRKGNAAETVSAFRGHRS